MSNSLEILQQKGPFISFLELNFMYVHVQGYSLIYSKWSDALVIFHFDIIEIHASLITLAFTSLHSSYFHGFKGTFLPKAHFSMGIFCWLVSFLPRILPRMVPRGFSDSFNAKKVKSFSYFCWVANNFNYSKKFSIKIEWIINNGILFSFDAVKSALT